RPVKSRRTDWTKLAILLALGALLVHCCQQSLRAEPATHPTTRPFDLRSDDAGRLVFTPLLPCDLSLGDGRSWTCGEDGTLEYSNFRPSTCWSDRARLQARDDWIE